MKVLKAQQPEILKRTNYKEIIFPEDGYLWLEKDKPLLHEKARHLALQVQLKILPFYEK